MYSPFNNQFNLTFLNALYTVAYVPWPSFSVTTKCFSLGGGTTLSAAAILIVYK